MSGAKGEGPRGLLVAGTRSGCGKTSVALGLLSALARRGLDVRPFKAGPDFIDPLHHAAASGRPSHNLDGWMLGPEAVRGIFARNAAGADLALAEGVMGLFDGASGRDETGSSAELSKLLGLPVLLVVDAASMARSAAALVHGFATFDPQLSFAGVALNRVGSARHEELLREALESAGGPPLLGCLPRAPGLDLPSRHLGLVTPGRGAEGAPEGVYARLADWVEAHLDLDALLARLPRLAPDPAPSPCRGPRVRLGVARDAAFCFCYPENLRLLEAAGAQIVPLSPLDHEELPPDLDGLYLPGGYPELHAERLSANTAMRAAVSAFCASGRPVYAECGGLLYLLDALQDGQGGSHAMCGVLGGSAAMRGRFRALGYREVRFTRATPLGPPETTARGHEFHYSELVSAPVGTSAYRVADRLGRDAAAAGWLAGPGANVLASYVHLHFASNPSLCAAFVDACLRARHARGATG